MEAHGSLGTKAVRTATGLLPDTMAAALMQKAGVDRLGALKLAVELVRRSRGSQPAAEGGWFTARCFCWSAVGRAARS